MYLKVYRKRLFHRVKLVARNGEVMLVSEAYFSKSNANKAALNLSKKLKVTVK